MSDPVSTPADLQALADDYEILAEIGRGGVSVVYLARERELEREVAIKVTRNRFVEDAEARVRVDREARTLAQLQHPNIVTLLASRRLPDGRRVLVMQLTRGRTLRALLQEQGPFPYDRTVQVLRQTASALAYLHQRGIVHRDVKPENVFLEDDGRILLSDLGIAKANDAPSNVTLTGVIVGTPTYMSPEQIDGLPLDGRSDQYSVGLLGYELLTGRRPWEGENLYSVIFKQKNEALPPLETLCPDVPRALREALTRAMQKDRDDRWAGMEEFCDHLTGTAVEPARPGGLDVPGLTPVAADTLALVSSGDPGLVAGTPEAESPASRRGPMRWRPALAASVVMALLAGGILYAYAGSDPAESTASLLASAVPGEAARTGEAALPGETGQPGTALAEPRIEPGVAAFERIPDIGEPPAAREVEEAPAEAPAATPRPQRTERGPAPAPDAAARPRGQEADPAAVERGRMDAMFSIASARSRPRVSDAASRPATTPEVTTVAAPAARYVPPALRNQSAVQAEIVEQVNRTGAMMRPGDGRVTLRISVDEQGRVTDSDLARSSGNVALDAALLQVSRRMRFSPAERNGLPVSAEIQLPVVLQPEE